MQTNGGGFAYDVGRAIRFLIVGGGCLNATGAALATGDWIVNDIINNM